MPADAKMRKTVDEIPASPMRVTEAENVSISKNCGGLDPAGSLEGHWSVSKPGSINRPVGAGRAQALVANDCVLLGRELGAADLP